MATIIKDSPNKQSSNTSLRYSITRNTFVKSSQVVGWIFM